MFPELCNLVHILVPRATFLLTYGRDRPLPQVRRIVALETRMSRSQSFVPNNNCLRMLPLNQSDMSG